MLAYAPQRRDAGAGQASRKTLMLVVAGHVALVAVALTTKMTIDIIERQPPTIVDIIKEPPPPPPPDPTPKPQPTTETHAVSQIDTVKPVIPADIPLGPTPETGPKGLPDVIVGPRTDPLPPVAVTPRHDPVKVGAMLRTSEAGLRPPYPSDKLRMEEEATLKLRLTIDEKGRVVAVDPVGKADPSFLAAARRHLIRSWRYKPATVDGVATGTTMVISLSFRLEDA